MSKPKMFFTILREIRRIDSIVDESISFIPFLVVVLLEVVVSRVDREVADDSLQRVILMTELIFFRLQQVRVDDKLYPRVRRTS
jgi:hypothetical protein